MTEKEIQQLNYINMFLNAIADSTNEILNHKYNCCVSHQMNLIYIGSGQSGDGIDLLNQYFLCKRKCNRIGYIYTNTFQDIYIPELSERGISMNNSIMYRISNGQ